jgi:hypothetical protein
MRGEVLKINELAINKHQCKLESVVQLNPALRLYSPLHATLKKENDSTI